MFILRLVLNMFLASKTDELSFDLIYEKRPEVCVYTRRVRIKKFVKVKCAEKAAQFNREKIKLACSIIFFKEKIDLLLSILIR